MLDRGVIIIFLHSTFNESMDRIRVRSTPRLNTSVTETVNDQNLIDLTNQRTVNSIGRGVVRAQIGHNVSFRTIYVFNQPKKRPWMKYQTINITTPEILPSTLEFVTSNIQTCPQIHREHSGLGVI